MALRLPRRKRVLLLDDDPSMQRLVSALLKRNGYRVDPFLTGSEAITALGEENYDVLLLDLMMPHEGGMTVIRHLRKHDPKKLDHAILFTGSPESLVASIQQEVAGVVKKPFKPEELLGAVKRVGAK